MRGHGVAPAALAQPAPPALAPALVALGLAPAGPASVPPPPGLGEVLLLLITGMHSVLHSVLIW